MPTSKCVFAPGAYTRHAGVAKDYSSDPKLKDWKAKAGYWCCTCSDYGVKRYVKRGESHMHAVTLNRGNTRRYRVAP